MWLISATEEEDWLLLSRVAFNQADRKRDLDGHELWNPKACLTVFLAPAELGIDLQGIAKRSTAILMHRLRSKSLMDLDMGGPLLFTTLLSAVHLLVRLLSLARCSTFVSLPGLTYSGKCTVVQQLRKRVQSAS